MMPSTIDCRVCLRSHRLVVVVEHPPFPLSSSVISVQDPHPYVPVNESERSVARSIYNSDEYNHSFYSVDNCGGYHKQRIDPFSFLLDQFYD